MGLTPVKGLVQVLVFLAPLTLAGCAGDSRWPRIEAEVGEDVDHMDHYAGTYSRTSDFEGRLTLRIREDGRCGWGRDSAGTVTSGPEGTARVDAGAVVINTSGRDYRYTKVVWGPRAYLIEQSEFPDFVSQVNLGRKKELAGRFLVSNAEAIPEGVQPELPEDWRGWLLAGTVEGKITEVLHHRAGKIDIGEAQGLKPGMRLLATDDAGQSFEIRIEKLEGTGAEVWTEHSKAMRVGQKVRAR